MSLRIYALQLKQESEVKVTLQRALKPHATPVVTTAVDSEGTLLATGASDGSIKVWDISGGYLTHTFHGHSGIVSALHFFLAPQGIEPKQVLDGKQRGSKGNQIPDSASEHDSHHLSLLRLVSGGDDGKIRLWNLTKRKATTTLDSHVSVVRQLDFSAKSKSLLSVSRDQTAIIWDCTTWKSKKVIPILETVEAGGFIEGGEFFFTGGDRGRVRLWDVSSGKEVSGEQPALGEADSIVQAIHTPLASNIVSVHTGHAFLWHSLRDFDANRGLPLPVIRHLTGSHDEVIDLGFASPDKSILALATNSEHIRLVSSSKGSTDDSGKPKDPHIGTDVATLQGHSEIIICIALDISGRWLATGAKDNTARLWQIDQPNDHYKHYSTFTGHAESIGAIALSQDADDKGLEKPPSMLLTGSNDRTIKRWAVPKSSLASSKALYTRKAHDKDINALSISTSFPTFATASQDRTVKVWSTDDGELQGILRGHKRGVWSIAFAPKKTSSITDDSGNTIGSSRGLLVSGSGDRTVKIWSLSDYACIRTFEGHTNNVLKVLWLDPPSAQSESSSSSKQKSQEPMIASAGADGLVKLWSPFSGDCLTTLDNHTDRVWALAFDSSNRTLVSGGADGVVTFWKDTSKETAVERSKAQAERVEQDQQLQNCERDGRWREGIVLALQLNHPARLLAIFDKVVNTSPTEQGSICGVIAVDNVIAELSDEQLLLLLMRVRDWNTNARTAPVAQRVLNVVVRKYSIERLAGLAKRRGGKDVLEALKAYTERHYRRMEELWSESWIVEFMLGEMDQLGVKDALEDSSVPRDAVMIEL